MWIQANYTLHLLWVLCCWHHRRHCFSSRGRDCYLLVTAIHLCLGSITTFTCCTSLADGALSAPWASPSTLSSISSSSLLQVWSLSCWGVSFWFLFRHDHLWNSTTFGNHRLHFILLSSARAVIITFDCILGLSGPMIVMRLLLFHLRLHHLFPRLFSGLASVFAPAIMLVANSNCEPFKVIG